MADTNTDVTSGDKTPDASGDTSKVDEESKDSVAYETHRKLLGEKKSWQQRAGDYEARAIAAEAKIKAEADAALESQGEYKTLLESERAESAKLRENIAGRDTEDKQARKLDAFLSAMDGTLKREYWGLVDLESVVVDPGTGEVDAGSVAKSIEVFRNKFPEVITPKHGKAGVPSNFPQGGDLRDKSLTDLTPKQRLEMVDGMLLKKG